MKGTFINKKGNFNGQKGKFLYKEEYRDAYSNIRQIKRKYELNLNLNKIKMKYTNTSNFDFYIGKEKNERKENERYNINEYKKNKITDERKQYFSLSHRKFMGRTDGLHNSMKFINDSESKLFTNRLFRDKDHMKKLADSMKFIKSPEINEEDCNTKKINNIFPISKRILLLKNMKSNIKNVLTKDLSRENSYNSDITYLNTLSERSKKDELSEMVSDIFFPTERQIEYTSFRSHSSIISPKLLTHSKKPRIKVPLYSNLKI